MDNWFYTFAATVGPFLPVLLLLYAIGFSYSIADRDIEIRLLRVVPFRTIPYERIEGLERTTSKLFITPFTARYTSRLVGPSVTIHIKGWRRPVEITPDYPDGFVRQVERRVLEQTGQRPWVR